MLSEQIKERLEREFPGATVEVNSDGSHFDVAIVSEAFDGLRAVKRQQLVYAALNEWITDGSVHAVNMKTLTPAEAGA